MLTGDASVTRARDHLLHAEVLANIALREGTERRRPGRDDEFHFYSEPDRGWAWQVRCSATARAVHPDVGDPR